MLRISVRTWSQRLTYLRQNVPSQNPDVRYVHKYTTFDHRVRKVDWYANKYTDTNKRKRFIKIYNETQSCIFKTEHSRTR